MANKEMSFFNDVVSASVDLIITNFQQCKYYEINGLLQNKSNSLIIIYITIRSLQKSFDSLQAFLCSLPNIPQMIYLSESRINQTPLTNIDLLNKKFIHKTCRG